FVRTRVVQVDDLDVRIREARDVGEAVGLELQRIGGIWRVGMARVGGDGGIQSHVFGRKGIERNGERTFAYGELVLDDAAIRVVDDERVRIERDDEHAALVVPGKVDDGGEVDP